MKRTISFLICTVLLVLSASTAFAVDRSVSAAAVWNREGDYYYCVENGEATIESFYGTVNGHLTIPEELGGYPVVRINGSVFAFEENIASVTIPDTVRSLGSYVFYGTRYYYDRANWTGELLYVGDYLVDCGTLLGKIKIKEGTRCIADNIIGYQRMTEIQLPKTLEEVGSNNFTDCDKLRKITVEEGSPYYFSDENGFLYTGDKTELIKAPMATDVTECELPEEVKVIGDFAFCNTGLEKVAFPKGLESIGESAFAYTNIGNITLPENISVIPDSAFDGCKNLKYIIICGKIETIGYYAFGNCENLKYIFFEGWNYGSDMDIFNGNEQWDRALVQYGFKDGVFIDFPLLDTLKYGDRLVLDLITADNFDDGDELVWSADSEAVTLNVSEDGKSCTVVPSKNGKELEDVTVEVCRYDGNGNVEIDGVEVTVDCRWFQKIFAFFRMIFGLTTIIYS